MERRLSDFITTDIEKRMGVLERYMGPNPSISSLEYDSRKAGPRSLYFALKGLHTDGHRFIDAAIQQGAAAVVHQDPLPEYREGIAYIHVQDSRFAMSPVADAFYGSPSRHLAVIGVTGTEGKSTTVYLIYQLLCLAGKRAGFISTVQFSDGQGEQWNPEHQTTPEAPAIHRLLAEMLANGAEYAVLEASSHGLSPRTNRLGDVAFDAAVMTNVTHEHLEFHGTWEQYRDDKANLFRALDRFSHDKSGSGDFPALPAFAIANACDPSAPYFASATDKRTLTYSARLPADLALTSLESGAQGNSYTALLRETGETLCIEDKLPGAFNAGNVLAALLAVSGILAVPVRELVPLVPSLKPVRGRMTGISRGQNFEVLVDYAHTPSSFETIFPPLRGRLDKNRGRIITLFGSAGERDTQKRPAQGRIAARWSDILVLADEDPRGEDPMAILEEIAKGIYDQGIDDQGMKNPGGPWSRGENLFLIPDRKAAIRKAFSLAQSGDLVLLLGKGHENSIIYADETMPYDEINEAEKALEEMAACSRM